MITKFFAVVWSDMNAMDYHSLGYCRKDTMGIISRNDFFDDFDGFGNFCYIFNEIEFHEGKNRKFSIYHNLCLDFQFCP
jgi:hypothetical protein